MLYINQSSGTKVHDNKPGTKKSKENMRTEKNPVQQITIFENNGITADYQQKKG